MSGVRQPGYFVVDRRLRLRQREQRAEQVRERRVEQRVLRRRGRSARRSRPRIVSAVFASITPPSRPFLMTIVPSALRHVALDRGAGDPEIEVDAVGDRDVDAEQRRARRRASAAGLAARSCRRLNAIAGCAAVERQRIERDVRASPGRTGCTPSAAASSVRSATPSQSLSRPSPQISGGALLRRSRWCRRSRPARSIWPSPSVSAVSVDGTFWRVLVGEAVAVVVLAVAGDLRVARPDRHRRCRCSRRRRRTASCRRCRCR